jgi:tetratricopeptide (TPR) repeat protein
MRDNGLPGLTEREGIVAFLGAGISTIAPTCLPSWWDLNEQVVLALAARVEPLLGSEAAADHAKIIATRQRAGRLPPEYQAELIEQHLQESYFRVLQCLDSQTPNAVHLQIARMASEGRIAAIVTTNFDRALEAAFESLGLEKQVYSSPQHFVALAAGRDDAARKCCPILKIHGSAEDPSSMVDTLSQRKRGLPSTIFGELRRLLRAHHWLFLGYSGADLDSGEDYLGLRAESKTARGMTWLVRPGTQPRRAVSEVCELYGKSRAAVVFGVLPDWLTDTTEADSSHDRFEVAVVSDRPSSNFNGTVASHATAWAAQLDLADAAIVLSRLLGAVGDSHAARDILTKMYTTARGDGPMLREHIQLVADLAARQLELAHYDEGLALYKELLALCITENLERSAARIIINSAAAAVHRGTLGAAERAYGWALEYFQKQASKPDLASAILNVAMLEADDQPDRALHRVSEALAILIELGDEPGEARARSLRATGLISLGVYEEAESELQRALKIFERLGNDRSVATALGNLALIYKRRGPLGEAYRIYQRVLSLCTELDEQTGRVITLHNLAWVCIQLQRGDEAERFVDQGILEAEKHGFAETLADLRAARGLLLRNSSRLTEARHDLEVAISYMRSANKKGRLAMALNDLATVELEAGNLDAAERLLEEAMALCQPVHFEQERCAILGNSAELKLRRNDPSSAIPLALKANEVSTRLELRQLSGAGLVTLGNAYHMLDRYEEALDAYRAAVSDGEAVGAMGLVFAAYLNAGVVFARMGLLPACFAAMDAAAASAVAPAERAQLARVLRQLADAYASKGHPNITQEFEKRAFAVTTRDSASVGEPGRRQCPCGSGEEFSQCHGRPG